MTSDEYAVLDRVGRLQLPHAYVEALGLERRVRLVLEDDHISLWRDDARFAPPVVEVPEVPEPVSEVVDDPHARYRPKGADQQ